MPDLRETFELVVVNQGKIIKKDVVHYLCEDGCPWGSLLEKDGYVRLSESTFAKSWNEAPAGYNPVYSTEILEHIATELA